MIPIDGSEGTLASYLLITTIFNVTALIPSQV